MRKLSHQAFAEQVQHVVQKHVSSGSRLLVAVSGGPDSVALAHILKGLPYGLVIGHVDHQLRKTSRQDGLFVKHLAERWDVSYRVVRVPVAAHAKTQGLGIEEAGRELRYRALLAMARKFKCQVILTAHTANDQAETVLMNHLRGAGPGGLAGIPTIRILANGVSLVRPMLDVRREAVISYLKANHLPYRQDPTNRQKRFRRNLIRHEALPYLERFYPGLSDRLVQSADIFREEEMYWQLALRDKFAKTVRKNNKRVMVDLTHLLGYHKALSRRILRQIVPGLSFQEIEQILVLAQSPESDRQLTLSGGVRIARQAQKLVISQRNS